MIMMMSTTNFDLFINLILQIPAYAIKSPRLKDLSDHFVSLRRKNFSIKEL